MLLNLITLCRFRSGGWANACIMGNFGHRTAWHPNYEQHCCILCGADLLLCWVSCFAWEGCWRDLCFPCCFIIQETLVLLQWGCSDILQVFYLRVFNCLFLISDSQLLTSLSLSLSPVWLYLPDCFRFHFQSKLCYAQMMQWRMQHLFLCLLT